MKVNEIFNSLQGEGALTGNAAIFIRFSGCNLKCPFCDTEHSSAHETSIEDIMSEIAKYPSKLVVLTGGEPTLQPDLYNLVLKLKQAGKCVAIETNGTRPVPNNIDWITLSPKYPYVKNAAIVLNKVSEVKVVITDNDYTDIPRFISKLGLEYIKTEHCFIQPCDTKSVLNDEITKKCVEFIKSNPSWKLSLQTQKILNVP